MSIRSERVKQKLLTWKYMIVEEEQEQEQEQEQEVLVVYCYYFDHIITLIEEKVTKQCNK